IAYEYRNLQCLLLSDRLSIRRKQSTRKASIAFPELETANWDCKALKTASVANHRATYSNGAGGTGHLWKGRWALQQFLNLLGWLLLSFRWQTPFPWFSVPFCSRLLC